MLSIGEMRNGQEEYYITLSREDYYHAGGEPPGDWDGDGAKALGLIGTVQSEELKRLFAGFHPYEDRALIQNAGDKDHQPGWDLTFSVPKSVSIIWSLGDSNTRHAIEEAQRLASKAALDYLQDNAAITRRGKGGARKEKANLIIAMFEHGTSRAQDQQLHTHCLVMNACVRDDGTTGTIESKPLYQHKMAAGAIHRAELSYQLGNQLGLAIERKGTCFEVVGVPQALINDCSTRRSDITRSMRERGVDGAEAAAKAALATRQVKGHVAREELFERWHEIGRVHNWGPDQAGELLTRHHTPFRDLKQDKSEALFNATRRITEQQSYFVERDLVRYIAEEAQGRGLSADTVRALAEKHLADTEEIIPLGQHKGELVYTTREMMDLEQRMLQHVERSKLSVSAGVSETILSGVISSRGHFSDEQAVACRHACAGGPGTIRVISGVAGSGKTTLLSAARLSWEIAGYEVRGAALAGKAAQKLAEESGIPSATLHRTIFDIEQGRMQLNAKSVLVVDEAGMIGTRLMTRLLECTNGTGARLVLTGERKQIQPIDAGGPYAEIETRLGAARLTEIHRQREAWARDAVHDFADGRARKGIEAYIERGLMTISKDRRSAYTELIAEWSTHGIRAPEDQLIFTGTRLEGTILNRMAQEVRMNVGALGKEFVTSPEGGDSFYVGDRVMFTKKSPTHGIENGSMGNVVGVDPRTSRLHTRLDSGDRVAVSLDQYSSVRLGYAVTTHKGQGATVERAFILAGGSLQDREITYVQTSRARGETRIFADEDTIGKTLTRLAQQMSTSRAKLMAHSIQNQSVRTQPDHSHGVDL